MVADIGTITLQRPTARSMQGAAVAPRLPVAGQQLYLGVAVQRCTVLIGCWTSSLSVLSLPVHGTLRQARLLQALCDGRE